MSDRGSGRDGGFDELPLDEMTLFDPPAWGEDDELERTDPARSATAARFAATANLLGPEALDRQRRAAAADLVATELEDLPVGVLIAGRYVTEGPIGEGGMGKVIRVRHRQLDRSFALKFMTASFAGNDRAREQFYREARLASSLVHPHIVSVIDFGEDPRLGAYMVMELLDGVPLSMRARGPDRFGLKAALDVIVQIAEALHYIHERHIVHGDIKPENMLLCQRASTERRRWEVKLLDFGLARIRTAGGTRASMVVDGTPDYISPERLRGKSPQPSNDIYSLGVLAYEMLTGRVPFVGSLVELMEAHVNLPPPAFAEITDQPIDERVEALVMRALAKDPADRHPDMQSFLYELRTLMDMLGMGKRRAARERTAALPEVSGRDRAAVAGFDWLPLPAAAVEADGTIVAANREFARFLTGDRANLVDGKNILATLFATIVPTLAEDLREVSDSKRAMHRVVRVRTQNGERPLVVLLVAAPDSGQVLLAIHGPVPDGF